MKNKNKFFLFLILFLMATQIQAATSLPELQSEIAVASQLLTQNRFSEVAESLAALEQNAPKDPDVLFLKASYLAQINDYVNAISVMTKVIELTPRSGKAFLQRGIFYVYALTYDKAMKDFRTSLKLLPKSDVKNRQMAYFQVALIALKYGNDRKTSQKYFKAGMELDPSSEMAQQMKSRSDL